MSTPCFHLARDGWEASVQRGPQRPSRSVVPNGREASGARRPMPALFSGRPPFGQSLAPLARGAGERRLPHLRLRIGISESATWDGSVGPCLVESLHAGLLNAAGSPERRIPHNRLGRSRLAPWLSRGIRPYRQPAGRPGRPSRMATSTPQLPGTHGGAKTKWRCARLPSTPRSGSVWHAA
jgi:hypothetical protein